MISNEKARDLKPGGLVWKATAGNTGIGIAVVGERPAATGP